MESVETSLRNTRLTDEAKETIKRLLVHIINPLHDDDRFSVIEHLCDEFDVYINDGHW